MPREDNVVYEKDAFAHIKDQTVPLVIYGPNNERIVIGEAMVDGDENGLRIISTKITDDRFKHILEPTITEFSIGDPNAT